MAVEFNPIPAPDQVQVTRALISVFEKAGIAEFASGLAGHGVELVSTGGTARVLDEAGLKVTDVASVTGFPEILDGRVKTLHPAIHGGLLAVRNDSGHLRQMEAHGIAPIDLVVTNLYPFEEVAARGADFAETVENIDIGGPAMIRAAAKNHAYVCVITDPRDYEQVAAEMTQTGGSTSLATRRRLAAGAFARTAAYDCAIADWFQRQTQAGSRKALSFAARLKEELRYGENPHQSAALYLTGDNRPGVARARQLQGKQLSFNNLNDADAAFELVSEFESKAHAAVAIIKHANPCGVAIASTLCDAYRRALACDPVSAFGGIVALNRELDVEVAKLILKLFTEVVIAPSASQDAIAQLATRNNLRVLVTGGMADPGAAGQTFRSIAGGLLAQSRDNGRVSRSELKIVTKRSPSTRELDDMLFAFTVAKHVKSNAIVYARNGKTVGIGAGQMSRVDSARIAAQKAEDAARSEGESESLAKGAVVASDAFFPFADGLLAAADAGATAVIQPGGSVRDEEVIEAADRAGLAMVLTGMRHFRH